MTAKIRILGAATLLPGLMLADFSYDQTSQTTGGAMAEMLKMAGAFSKQAREPIRATVAVKGNRMYHGGEHHTQIIDLDTETFTDVNHDRKTYSVMTFAEMTKAMQDAMASLKDPQKTDSEIKVSVKETGNTKVIGGLDAKEMVMTFDVQARDPKTGQTATMQMTNNMWMVPKIDGYDEVRDFYKKMSQKLAWTPGGMQTTGPGSEYARGFAEAAKQTAKLDGVPVLQVMRFGSKDADAALAQQQSTAPQGATQQRPPQQSQQQKEAEKPSVSSALGGALGGRLGGLGGFGRKKKPAQQEEPKEQPKAEAAAAPQPEGAPAGGALMEVTTETANFSTASVDSAKFSVPSGYKKVDSEMLRRPR
jgi:hypothetical protein